MSYQSEQELENQLLSKLGGREYNYVKISSVKDLENNFRKELNRLNAVNLNGKELSDKEFERTLTLLQGKSVFESAKQLRDKFQLERDNGERVYMMLIDFEDQKNNNFEITNQVTVRGKYENRYDVTILLNGLPVVQIELKRRGMHIMEAFNQVCRYQKHSYVGLFKYLQLLVISNGVDTKYFANSDRPYMRSHTFFWTDESNRRITNLSDFADSFLNQKHLFEMMDTFTVLNDTESIMMVMRPYQVYATKNIIKMVKETRNGGFVWHSTGSGKTLTSFKASQIIARDKNIKKVIFLVDRRDLDTQTFEEFNKFEEGSVDNTEYTRTLVKHMKDESVNLIITTVQKMLFMLL